MKNIKIGLKLTIGFGMLLIVTAIITAIGAIGILQVNRNYSYVLEYPNNRYSVLRDLESDLLDMRRIVVQASFSLGNISAIDVLQNEYDATYRNIRLTLEEYNRSLLRDTEITANARNIMLADVAQLERLISNYTRHVSTPTFVAARADNFNQVSALLPLNTAISNDISAQFMEIFALTQEQMDAIGGEMSSLAERTVWIVVALAIVAVAAGILVAVLITRSITKPLNRAVSVISDVANGNLNVNFDMTNMAKDEIGILTRDIVGLVHIIKSMVDDLIKTHHEYIEIGNIHYAIDDSKYQNSYGEMIGLVNKLLSAVTLDIEGIAETLIHIADGDFKKTVDTDVWVGEWVIMPNALLKLTNNLNSVKNEISEMIDAASVKGDLNFTIDADKYTGDWRDIMGGLNDIAKAVDMPLKVIHIALTEMQAGNLDLTKIAERMQANNLDPNPDNYNGIFNDILTACKVSFGTTSSYIYEIEQILAKMASGDLRNSISREYVGSFDLIKRSVNDINSTLHKTMSEISTASEQVLSGAQQISNSAQELANGAQEQASSVQELNATIDMISQQTRRNADSATEANELSDKSTVNAKEGNESMNEMLIAMAQIKESSSDISKIIKAIQEIAFQTNLLALNAAVEAARAGEHGRGFSVVAEEVRNLAMRSQGSAAETTSLIETSIRRVESGSTIAETTSHTLDRIVKTAADVSEIISNISAASKEQTEAIAHISSGLTQISDVTQNNSAVSEETAAASEELSSQAEVLKQLVSYFKL